MPQIWYNPCIAHVVNLVSHAWAGHVGFDLVNQVLRQMKASFVHSTKTRDRWFKYQQRFSIQNPTKVPLANDTRWDTWYYQCKGFAYSPFVLYLFYYFSMR